MDCELEAFLRGDLVLALGNIRKHLLNQSSADGLSLRPEDVTRIASYLASVEAQAEALAGARVKPTKAEPAVEDEALEPLSSDRAA